MTAANELTARALVVDDDDEIRLMVSRILEREGYQVDGVHDGFEAIETLKTEDYDLILLDLMMPHVDGFGVISLLQEARPDILGNVIVMTAVHPSGIEEKIARVLIKPFDIFRLIAYAREHARQQRGAIPLASHSGESDGSMEV